jgi:hypothetical protein
MIIYTIRIVSIIKIENYFAGFYFRDIVISGTASIGKLISDTVPHAMRISVIKPIASLFFIEN